MKKFMMIAAMAALALTGCVKNEGTDLIDEKEIGFNTIANKASKAIVDGATLNQATDKFNVWGFFSDDAFATTPTDFMTGVEISYVTDAWRNATKKYYWPLSGEIDFIGIYPSTVTPTSVSYAAGATINDYAITDTNKTTDLMYAEAKGSRQSAALPIVFKHALSQIYVQLKTNDTYDGATFKVNSIVINNIATTGSFVQKPTTGWTAGTQNSNFSYLATTSAAVTATPADYGTAILMIPQTMDTTGAQVTDKSHLAINYTLSQTGASDITSTVNVAIVQEWEMNHKYKVTLSFGLDEITFNPSVTAYVEGAEISASI